MTIKKSRSPSPFAFPARIITHNAELKPRVPWLGITKATLTAKDGREGAPQTAHHTQIAPARAVFIFYAMTSLLNSTVCYTGPAQGDMEKSYATEYRATAARRPGQPTATRHLQVGPYGLPPQCHCWSRSGDGARRAPQARMVPARPASSSSGRPGVRSPAPAAPPLRPRPRRPGRGAPGGTRRRSR